MVWCQKAPVLLPWCQKSSIVNHGSLHEPASCTTEQLTQKSKEPPSWSGELVRGRATALLGALHIFKEDHNNPKKLWWTADLLEKDISAADEVKGLWKVHEGDVLRPLLLVTFLLQWEGYDKRRSFWGAAAALWRRQQTLAQVHQLFARPLQVSLGRGIIDTPN